MELESKKYFSECQRKAIKKNRTCFYPECSKKAINSHILQQNGILSTLTKDNHLWELKINPFKKPHYYPHKTGINEAFSFNCFCNEHDSKLFSKIEKAEIDFDDYGSRLLFVVRAIYNELFRKLVVIDQSKCLISKLINKNIIENVETYINFQELGIQDLSFMKQLIWHDLKYKSESFVLHYREINRVDVILSSIFNYETTNEIINYRLSNGGKSLERLTLIFITIFPYKNKSILLMGYAKEDETKLKSYFYPFFKENEKKVQRKITNLMLFQCENWVCSEDFYIKKIMGKEMLFADAMTFSSKNDNERKNFNINIFCDDFDKKIIKWHQEYV